MAPPQTCCTPRQTTCPECAAPLTSEVIDEIAHVVCEEKIWCDQCGWSDYWAYGHYESQHVPDRR